jgi:hypothetical protein
MLSSAMTSRVSARSPSDVYMGRLLDFFCKNVPTVFVLVLVYLPLFMLIICTFLYVSYVQYIIICVTISNVIVH